MRRNIEIGTRHLYAMYRKNNRKNKDFPPVDYDTYRKVLRRFGDNFIKQVIANREGVDFPMNRGHLMITKWISSAKPKERKDGSLEHLGFLAKDWSKEARMDNGHAPVTLNDHSDGYKFRWNWRRSSSKVTHRTMITLDIIRKWDRYLAQSIFSGKQDYYTT